MNNTIEMITITKESYDILKKNTRWLDCLNEAELKDDRGWEKARQLRERLDEEESTKKLSI